MQRQEEVIRLNATEIEERLSRLPDWSLRDGTLFREFVFDSFARAFGFMTSVAISAEAMNHHPDWSNVYTRISIRLSTHEIAGISWLDFELAKRIDEVSAGSG